MLSLNDKITMIIGSSNPANTAGILSNAGHLQCSEILSIFDGMFVLGSSLSHDQLDSVIGVKACYESALGQAELASAMEHTLGYSGMWDRIFAEEPGTENDYIHHIRQNQPDLFLYHALLVLNDYGYLDNIALHLNGVYIGPWLDAVKNHFGEDYYNSYIAKLLPGNYSSSWVYKLNEQHIYGSSRIGLIQRDLTLIRQKHGENDWNWVTTENDTVFVYNYTSDSIKYHNRGAKRYELSNHLGNVLAVITDSRIQACETGELMHYEAQIVQVTDYYPFGSVVEKRVWKGGNGYRYGFSGGEKINEISGEGNYVDIGERGVDTRLGRLNWRIDPDFAKYPYSSPYTYAANNPIRYIDIDGRGPGDAVIVFAGGDLLANGGLGSVQGIVDYVKKNDFNQNGGYASAFASKYWGVSMKSTKDLDVATQAAYEAVKANHNVHNGEKVEGGKVIIYGYSWGGVLAQHLTDRLKADGIEVELLITVDAAAGPQSDQVDRTVSDNVKENLNIYQTNPSTWPVQSYGGENTADSDKTKVTNSNYTGYYTGTPGQSDFQKVEHSTIDEISQPRVNQKIINTVKPDGQ